MRSEHSDPAAAVARLTASARRHAAPALSDGFAASPLPEADALVELDPIAARHRWGNPTMTRGTALSAFFLAAVVVLCLGVWSLWQYGTRSESLVTQRPPSPSARRSPSLPTLGNSTAATATAQVTAVADQSPRAGSIVVHVVGLVRHPGLVTLGSDARVSDAVAAAGGPKPGAVLARINLARHLHDGEQLMVPDGDDPVPPIAVDTQGALGTGSSGESDPSGAATGNGRGLVNLNTATLADLDALPGVGPVTAQRIVDWRREHQRFTRVEELTEVKGIGPTTLERLRSLVTV